MTYIKKTLEDIQVSGKKVLVRCDFNVPLNKSVITDENRLIGALATIKYLIKNGAKVILCSHLGKPKGEPKPELSLKPVALRLSELLGQGVVFAADENVVGVNARKAVAEMGDGDVVLLQNTRYRVEEQVMEKIFQKSWPPWPRYLSTMLLVQPIELIPQQKELPIFWVPVFADT